MQKTPLKSGLFSKPLMIFIVLIFLGLIYYSKNFFLAAKVNGDLIYKSELLNTLVKQSGKDVLEGMVAERLILQEAKKRIITISKEEAENEVKKIEKNVTSQGQKLDQVLALQGLTREKFREQVKVQKILEKMFSKDINVTDKEIDEFLKTNEQFLTGNADIQEVRKNVLQQLRQNKLRDKIQELIQKLKKDSQIDYLL